MLVLPAWTILVGAGLVALGGMAGESWAAVSGSRRWPGSSRSAPSAWWWPGCC